MKVHHQPRVLGTGVSSAGSLPAKRGPKPGVLSVPCADCGAGVTEECRKLDGSGEQAGTRHTSRRRVAQRNANRARGL